MKLKLYLVALLSIPLITWAAWAMRAETSDEAGAWSPAVNGLQARLRLKEKPKINGTRMLVPFLELRNVTDAADPMMVRCGEGHVTFEFVTMNDGEARDGWSLPRSGLHSDPGTITLPHDSLISISMYCSNWAVPKDAAAMIATDTGVWMIQNEEKGKVFLRATITGEPGKSVWNGKIQTPLASVDWE